MNLEGIFSDLLDKITSWFEALILLLPNFLIAALILLGSMVVARMVRSGVRNILQRVSHNHQVNKLFSTLAAAAVLITGAFIALGIVGLDDTVTTLLAGVGIIGLALGFAFQDIAQNFIAGVLMAFRRPLREGDLVKLNEHFGVVEDLNLRTTIVRLLEGQHVLIPNKDVFQNPIINFSRTTEHRVDISCGVSYGDDLELVERVACRVCESLDSRIKNRPVEFFYEEFGDSSINFTLRFWITFHKQTDFLRARSEAVKMIKRAFDENGITIPFPIRTLDFGIVGGEKLSDVLPPHLYEPGQHNGRTDRS